MPACQQLHVPKLECSFLSLLRPKQSSLPFEGYQLSRASRAFHEGHLHDNVQPTSSALLSTQISFSLSSDFFCYSSRYPGRRRSFFAARDTLGKGGASLLLEIPWVQAGATFFVTSVALHLPPSRLISSSHTPRTLSPSHYDSKPKQTQRSFLSSFDRLLPIPPAGFFFLLGVQASSQKGKGR